MSDGSILLGLFCVSPESNISFIIPISSLSIFLLAFSTAYISRKNSALSDPFLITASLVASRCVVINSESFCLGGIPCFLYMAETLLCSICISFSITALYISSLFLKYRYSVLLPFFDAAAMSFIVTFLFPLFAKRFLATSMNSRWVCDSVRDMFLDV